MNIDQVTNISKLDVQTWRPDLRRDLHIFVDYIRKREVKRSHRTNALGKADAKRLAQMFSDPDAEEEVAEEGDSGWVDFVDGVARRLGLVHYDTTGTYAGYTSREPSFPDNYIQFDAKAYRKLSSLKLADQEKHLLESLLSYYQGGSSEFYGPCFRGALGGFSNWGSATGVMPSLDFAAIRRFLLELLADCPVGQWLSVAGLVEYLKKQHRYFLIPKKPNFKKKWEKDKGRYGNFRESKKGHWGHEIEIKEADTDSFERVEGRYVERFLENIPHLLGYVDVAYAKKQPKGVYPSLGFLKAFRVNERLRRALEGQIAEPTLKITPSFDLYLQSEFYPARLIGELRPICDLVSEDTAIVFRLVRQKVAKACADNPKLDVVRLLESISTEPLPENVRREISEWSAHSDKFVLYGTCSILESNDQIAAVERFRVQAIAKGVDLVRSPDKLYEELEQQELAPLRIKHGDESFSRLPAKTRSVFPRNTGKKRREPKPKVTLMRVTQVQLLCPDRDFLQRLQGLLAAANCPVEADRKRLALAFSSRHEKEVSRAIRALKKDFDVKIDDQ